MKDLTKGKEGRLILLFALPMLLGNVFQQLYNVTDSIIVGNYLGKEALSAVGASFPVFFALISLIIGLASGSAIVISQFFGAKKYKKVQLAVDTMVIVLFLAAIIIGFLGIFFVDEIFTLIKLPPQILPKAKTYLIITLAGLIFDFGYNGTAAILRSIGDSKTPVYFLVISTITNIVLDILFIVVFGFGIEGVAFATVISKAGAFITAVFYVNKTNKVLKIRIFNVKFDKEIFKKSIKIGLPSGFQQFSVAIGMTVVFSIVNKFGATVIAAYSVAGRLDFFAMMPSMNFAIALTSFVGQNIGAGKIDRVKKGMRFTMMLSASVAALISLIIYLLPKQLMGIFTPDPDVVAEGVKYLLIVSPGYIIFSVMLSLSGVFRGAGDTLIPMFMTIFTLWVIRVPLAFYWSDIYGQTGIWWAIPTAWSSGMVISIAYYLTGKWKTKSVVKHNSKPD